MRSAPERDFTTTSILIVDDDAMMRLIASTAVDNAGFIVHAANDGLQALDVLAHTPVDLVMLDVMLPGKSGFEILHDLRADPAFVDMPILMLTARGQSRDREMAARAGVSRFMTKPFSNAEMLDAVRELTHT